MRQTNHDGDSFESMRDSNQPIAVIGQGDSRTEIEPDDVGDGWGDVLLCAGIIAGLALILYLTI